MARKTDDLVSGQCRVQHAPLAKMNQLLFTAQKNFLVELG
jgi:hypothetical protein